MKGKKIILFFLVIFHLSVFLFPFLIKSFHQHAQVTSNQNISGILIKSFEKPCLVCNFEFVRFEINNQGNFSCYIPSIELKNSIDVIQPDNKIQLYFSFRAPPLV